MSKKIFKKPAIGRVHLKMSTSNARQVLTSIGPVLAQKFSALLGGVKVRPLVTTCQAKPGFHRLLFDVPLGTKLPKGVDTLPIKSGTDVVRVTTFPLEAISLDLYGFFEKYGLFYTSSKIDAKGNIFLRFDGTADQLEALRAVAKKRGIKVRELGEPKRGQKKLGIYLLAEAVRVKPKHKRLAKKKVSPAPRSAKPKAAPDQTQGLNPESLRLLAWHVLMTLPKEEMLSIISSAIETLSSGERAELLKELATLDGLKLVQSKVKAKPYSGIKVEDTSLN